MRKKNLLLENDGQVQFSSSFDKQAKNIIETKKWYSKNITQKVHIQLRST